MHNENESPVCGITFIDEKKVNSARKKIPANNLIADLADKFSQLSDFTRLKIIHALSKEELCVCDISSVVGISVSAISHQLGC